MVMNAQEEHFGSVHMGHQMMEGVGLGQIACADHNGKDHNLES